jgi:diguanylate cyclase (GGDEF)-like protein
MTIIFTLSVVNILSFFSFIILPENIFLLNFGIIFLSLVILKYAQDEKKFYILANVTAVMIMVLLSIVLFILQGDVLRAIWFIPTIIAVYIGLSRKTGIIYTVYSVFIITVAYKTGYLNLPNFSYVTLILSIVSSTILGVIVSFILEEYDKDMHIIFDKLHLIANTDYLTTILNRRAFIQEGKKIVEKAKKNAKPVCIIMMDIDHFKKINDTYGHQEGDIVLQIMVEIVKGELKDNMLFGRLGGEEFAVLAVCGREECIKLAERIRQKVEQNKNMPTTLSLGVYVNNSEVYDISTILKKADEALYEAKRSGRNRVCVC